MVGRCKQVVAALQVLSQVLLYCIRLMGVGVSIIFIHFQAVLQFFFWDPSLSADLCYLVDTKSVREVSWMHFVGPKICSRRCKKRCNCRGHPDCSGVELNFARRILLWNVSRNASACLCNRQTDA